MADSLNCNGRSRARGAGRPAIVSPSQRGKPDGTRKILVGITRPALAAGTDTPGGASWRPPPTRPASLQERPTRRCSRNPTIRDRPPTPTAARTSNAKRTKGAGRLARRPGVTPGSSDRPSSSSLYRPGRRRRLRRCFQEVTAGLRSGINVTSGGGSATADQAPPTPGSMSAANREPFSGTNAEPGRVRTREGGRVSGAFPASWKGREMPTNATVEPAFIPRGMRPGPGFPVPRGENGGSAKHETASLHVSPPWRARIR